MQRVARVGRWCSLDGDRMDPRSAPQRRGDRPVRPAGGSVSTVNLSTTADPRLDGRAVQAHRLRRGHDRARVRELGERDHERLSRRALLVLGLLKGSFIFLSDLVREIRRPLQVDFLVASSYGEAMSIERQRAAGVRSGNHARGEAHPPGRGHRGLGANAQPCSGPAGRARAAFARDLRAAAQAHRRDLRYPTRFIGFDAPNEFLVGYGLDHAENFRHMPYIASLQ